MLFSSNKKKNILILGSNGMLGYEIFMKFRELSQRKNSNIGVVIGLDVEDNYDFSDPNTLRNYFDGCIQFDYCINCIAYTDTAKAENEGRDMSYRLNALVPKNIAEACVRFGVHMIHVSTDYVFSQNSAISGETKLKESDEPFPVNMYGLHKLLGEQFIQNAFCKWQSGYAICRTSWLYGMHNSKSFIHKFMRNVVCKALAGKTEIEMTSNEVSVPTSTKYVLDAIVQIVDTNRYGIFHMVPVSDNGITRVEWAEQILASYPPETKIGNICISDMTVKPVRRDNMLQPSVSAMETSMSGGPDFAEVLADFMEANGKTILDQILSSNK